MDIQVLQKKKKTMSLMYRKTVELPASEIVAGWRGEEGMHLITRSRG